MDRMIKTRWLTGNEYFNLLSRMLSLKTYFKIPLLEDGNHPDKIYFTPVNG